jgi:hypothetical protein
MRAGRKPARRRQAYGSPPLVKSLYRRGLSRARSLRASFRWSPRVPRHQGTGSKLSHPQARDNHDRTSPTSNACGHRRMQVRPLTTVPGSGGWQRRRSRGLPAARRDPSGLSRPEPAATRRSRTCADRSPLHVLPLMGVYSLYEDEAGTACMLVAHELSAWELGCHAVVDRCAAGQSACRSVRVNDGGQHLGWWPALFHCSGIEWLVRLCRYRSRRTPSSAP